MDDPWGSPWADEVQLPQTSKPEEKRDVEIRPTTPARAATSTLQEKTNSPWDDTADDGFGDWATLPRNDGRDLGMDGQDDIWEDNAPALEITTNKPATEALSVNWSTFETPDDQGAKLAPSPSFEVAQPTRLPSPDPWETSFMVDKELTENNTDNVVLELQGVSGVKEEELYKQVSAVDEEQTSGEALVLSDEKTAETEFQDIESAAKGIEPKDADITPSPSMLGNAKETDNSDMGPPSSHRSSSPSEHSQHDEMSQESPRTSLDEEPKRPQRPRVVSSKIQELVEHFDGLAKPDTGDAALSSTSSGHDTIIAVGETELEEDDDFGDFEEGQSDEEQEQGEPEQPPNAHNQSKDDQGASRLTSKMFEGPVDFDIDISLAGKLFPNLEVDSTSEKIFIPDTVPYDSFSTTEERKTWYRISRYGTMRKYNSGEDDYVRINWAQSQIRKETLNTVARWMEEDRISGRVVLGGASKGSSIFGWNDKKVPPVPLANAFASQGGKRKVEPVIDKAPEIPREWPQDLARNSSTSKSSSHTSRQNSLKTIDPGPATGALLETTSIVESPVASFGWNAAPLKPSSPSNNPRPGHKSTGSMSSLALHQPKLTSLPQRSLSVKKNPKTKLSNIFSAPARQPLKSSFPEFSNSNTPSIKPLTSLAIPAMVDDDDDEDWGEMVASPVVNIGASTALSSEPLKPQAKNSATTPIVLDSVISPVLNHGPNPSLDKIFTPVSDIPNPFDDIAGGGSSGHATHLATSAAVDPWASADFSFFETNSAPVSPPNPIIRQPAQLISKSVRFSPAPPPVKSDRKSKEEVEQDRIVQRIVKSLPDLSYMLKR